LPSIIEPSDDVDLRRYPYATTLNNEFALFTLANRLPGTIDRLLLDSSIGRTSWSRLSKIRESLISQGRVPPLEQNPFFDEAVWKHISGSVKSWRSAPFINFEYYLYYKVLEATGSYFHLEPTEPTKEQWILASGDQSSDPFKTDKDYPAIGGNDKYWSAIEAAAKLRWKKPKKTQLKEAVFSSLYNNQRDASQLRQFNINFVHSGESRSDDLIKVDHSAHLVDALLSPETSRIDIVSDNFYHEFVSDLSLAETIIRTAGKKVNIWVKNVPSFVSDVTITDWERLKKDLLASPALSECFKSVLDPSFFSVRSARHLDTHLSFSDALYPPQGIAPSAPLQELFQHSHLIIIKGDLNYRKLVEDRLWEPTLAVRKTIDARIFCVRAVKSACVVGVDESEWPVTLDMLNASLPSLKNPRPDYNMIIQEFR